MKEEYTEKDFQGIVNFLKTKRFLDVKSDMVGKTLFRRNNVLLIDCLNDVMFSGLGFKIVGATCVDPELGADGRSPETGSETGKAVKTFVLDLLARITWIDENEVVPPGESPTLRQGLVNIEMQRKHEQSFCNRAFNYAGRIMTFSMYAGDSWKNSVPVWTVAICETSPFVRPLLLALRKRWGYLETSSMRRDRAPHSVVTKVLSLFLILSEFKKDVRSLKTGCDFWYFFHETFRYTDYQEVSGSLEQRRYKDETGVDGTLLEVSTDDALMAWVAASAERRANKEESDRQWRRSEAKKQVWAEGEAEGKVKL